MAQDVAELLRQSRAEKASGPAASSSSSRAVALDLASLIAPYRRQGRFTLRIENLPQGARLTAGRNNGDRTWSLALDELDGLSYFPPAEEVADFMQDVDNLRSDAERLVARVARIEKQVNHE